jgi:Tfp pilus assembly protein PilO
MKPARRTAKPGARAARSGNRAVIALAVLGAFAVAYGWNSLFLAPRSRARAAVEKDLVAVRQQEQELRQNLGQLRRLATDTQTREAELAELDRLVPADADVGGAIVALDAAAKQAQVDWSSFVPTPPAAPAGGGPATVGLSIKIGGTFDQIFDYLRRLESLDRLVVVDAVQLTAGNAAGTGPPKLEAELKARMFAAGTATRAPAPFAATAAALPKAGG